MRKPEGLYHNSLAKTKIQSSVSKSNCWAKIERHMPKQKQKDHIPVLLHEVIQYLNPKAGDRYLDLTAGYGGHASAVLQMTSAEGVLVDRDSESINKLSKQFQNDSVRIVQNDFFTAAEQFAGAGESFQLILADLGVSSPHLDNADRGFSILQDGPLDMRMDGSQPLTAEQVVNEYEEGRLAEILRSYGQEPKARQIARLIVDNRPISSTVELANIVARAWSGHSRVHPATRTFQAIRIEVNDELRQIEQALPYLVEMLDDGGRLAIISFHSLEDAIVKRFFQDNGGDTYDAELAVLTKKPVLASKDEIVSNPRARSAKLRVAVKIKTTGKGT